MNELERQLEQLERELTPLRAALSAAPPAAFSAALLERVAREAGRVRTQRALRRRIAALTGLAAAIGLMFSLRTLATPRLDGTVSAIESAWAAGDPDEVAEAWLSATAASGAELTDALTVDWNADTLELIESDALAPDDWERSLDASFEALTDVLGA